MTPSHDASRPADPFARSYDLAVIGGGSAGFAAAIAAAEEGAEVALVNAGTIGGTCVNVGCVPSKALIRAVEIFAQAPAARRFGGIEAEARLIDWAETIARKRALVDGMRTKKYVDLLPAWPAIRLIEGKARFGAGGAIMVDGRRLDARRAVIATGSRPHLPPIEGLAEAEVLTSAEALDLETLPARLIVIGAGYVGCELAQLFSRAGVHVTLVSRHGILPRAEPEIRAELARHLAAEGLELVTTKGYRAVERVDGETRLHLEDGVTLAADALLVATGRVPNTDDLGLAEAGVETDRRGFVVTDTQMATSAPGIFAAGDVTGRDLFVYMAAHEGRIAALNAVKTAGLSRDEGPIPSVVFTDPALAAVGMTEEAARSAGHDVITSLLPLEAVPRAVAARDVRGLIKLVAERESGRLLGGQILAPEAGDSIQTLTLAIRQGMTHEELATTIFPYLTTVEGLKLAAQTFEKDVNRLSCCAG